MESESTQIPPFEPFDKIKICGNIIGTKYIFDIRGYIPMIIGKSDEGRPLVWFYARLRDGKQICVVDRNVSQHRQVTCRDDGDLLVFNIQNPQSGDWVTFFKMIVSKQYIPEVVELDLRPFGIDIHGVDDELFIGKSSLKNNIIVGSEVFFKY